MTVGYFNSAISKLLNIRHWNLAWLFPWEFFPARTTVIFGSVTQDYNAVLKEEGNWSHKKQATQETPKWTLLKWNKMTAKQRDGCNSVQTNANWFRWKEVYTRSTALCPDGYISEMWFGYCARNFHTNAASLFLGCWSLAALCKSLPTWCPSACWGHSNLEQHLTHNQKQHLYTLRSMWQKSPRVCQNYTNNNFGDWQCTRQVFVEMTSGLNGAQHQSVCTFWKATIIHVLKKMRTVQQSYQISTLTSNAMSVISMVNSLFSSSLIYYSEIY